MLKQVGFLQYIQKDWLDATVAFYQNCQNIDEIKANLNNLIISDVPKSEERRKTIDVLTRTWIRVPKNHQNLRNTALEIYDELEPDERIILHWGMLLLAYPFFHDVVKKIGIILRIQDNFTPSQLRNKLVSSWGHRTTIIRAIDRVIQSLKNWKVLVSDNRSIKSTTKLKIKNEVLCLWFLEAIFTSKKVDSIFFDKLISSAVLFPFELLIPMYKIKQSENFEYAIHGMNVEILSLKKINFSFS